MRRFIHSLIICAMLWAMPALGQEMTQGYVLQAVGRLIFIDKGEQDDVRPGDLLQVVRQETIIHPVTGENLGAMVALGAVRVVEVFPKLSTAEVVDLLRGVTIESLDMEAKQGLIRTQPLPPEQEMMMQEKMVAEATGMMAPPGRMNPDGILRQLTPEVRLGFGSRPDLSMPDRVYKLLSASQSFAQATGPLIGTLSDTAFGGIANTALMDLADTTSAAQNLGSLGSSVLTSMAFTYPLTERVTALGNIDLGVQSRVAVGARIYAGRLLRFLGSGYTPEGRVGEVVISVKLGWGGQGARSLPVDALTGLSARTDLLADSVFVEKALTISLLPDSITVGRARGDALIVQADSLLQAEVTTVLQGAATDSIKLISERGIGVAWNLTLPLSRHFILKAHMTRVGNVDEIGGKLRYYLRAVDKDSPRANPDGTIRSLVMSLGANHDATMSRTSLDFGFTVPLVQRITLSTGFQTDFKGYNRFGLALKSYL